MVHFVLYLERLDTFGLFIRAFGLRIQRLDMELAKISHI